MTQTNSSSDDEFFVGWDVGGWNCEKNSKSRDALVVLDQHGKLVGKPWRGNLANTIMASSSAGDFIAAILILCGIIVRRRTTRATIAIDAPLAFPEGLLSLLVEGRLSRPTGVSSLNEYLFRGTERRLATATSTPLSVVKDMIGSQSTKAIHAVRKFSTSYPTTGVWCDLPTELTFIETYPSVCRRRLGKLGMSGVFQPIGHNDIIDAAVCAHIARMFAHCPESLEGPSGDFSSSEGWIWVPREATHSRVTGP